MKEITIEITDYCPNECSYCSSNAGPDGKNFLSINQINDFLKDKVYDRINISGGEPLSHPDFYKILKLCKTYVTPRIGFVAVYTNELDCVLFNANIIPGVRVEANVPLLTNTSEVHLLKMVKQGYEAKKPKVHYSCNWDGINCGGCLNKVLKPDGTIGDNPCTKNL
jgi:hypothetical protein